MAKRSGDIALRPGDVVQLGPLRVEAVPAPGHPHWLQRLPGYDQLLALTAVGAGVWRCGQNLGYVLRFSGRTVWWTGDMVWDEAYVEQMLTRHMPDIVLVHVQPSDFGPLNFLVPPWRLGDLRRRVELRRGQVWWYPFTCRDAGDDGRDSGGCNRIGFMDAEVAVDHAAAYPWVTLLRLSTECLPRQNRPIDSPVEKGDKRK